MFREEFNAISSYLNGGIFHIGAAVLLALLAAAPMDRRRFLITMPICILALAVYHVFCLCVAALCPFPVMGRELLPQEMYYLEKIPPITRQILANLHVFNIVIGWQLAPLLIWGFISVRVRREAK